MAATSQSSKVLLFDDEPHNVQYVIDYLEHKGLTCLVAQTADDAVRLLENEIYRAVIIDLNIPISSSLITVAQKLGTIYVKYPGLYIAYYARNKGYRERQTVVYSVHKDEAIAVEAKKLSFTYLIKGRPLEIKAELDDIMSFDPTATFRS